MSEVNDSADGEFEVANSELCEGLKTCRSVINNYRRLLSSNDNLAIGQAPQGAGDSGTDISVEG